MKKISIAIAGATGLVGTTLLNLLAERKFPINSLYLLASDQSAGKTLFFQDKAHAVNQLSEFDFSKSDISFFCVSNQLSEQYAPISANANSVVIDKSYFYRNHADVPLIVPEVNLAHLANFRRKNIISSPNCTTIPIAVALKPIYDAVGIARINISTYQSVSGSGKEALQELEEQTHQLLNKKPITPKVYPHQIAFNVLPQIDDFETNGYTREEMKLVWELRKLFNDNSIAINPTAVRVPVFCGHAASVHLETRDKISIKRVLDLLKNAKGVKLSSGDNYPTPAKDAAGQDLVYVGRVREDISHAHGINLWIVSDNLRKGAALNAIQIAENLLHLNYV